MTPTLIKTSHVFRQLSLHALVRAFDLNPRENPFIKGDVIQPDNAVYKPGKEGTLTVELVEFLTKRGWRWGGNYESLKDYQHLEKLCGVQKIATDDYGYAVSVVWKDGEISESHFPIGGFAVINPKTNEKIRENLWLELSRKTCTKATERVHFF
jgi:hypothetical protein